MSGSSRNGLNSCFASGCLWPFPAPHPVIHSEAGTDPKRPVTKLTLRGIDILNTKRIDIVLVKLGAVFIVVYALQSLSYYISFLMGAEEYISIAAVVFCLVFILPATFSWALWRFPATITGALYDKSESPDESDGASQSALLIGVTLIGLYTLVFGIIDLVYFEAHRYAELQLAKDANFPDYPILPETVAGRITNIVQVVLGGILIYGRNGISVLLRQVRTAGISTS